MGTRTSRDCFALLPAELVDAAYSVDNHTHEFRSIHLSFEREIFQTATTPRRGSGYYSGEVRAGLTVDNHALPTADGCDIESMSAIRAERTKQLKQVIAAKGLSGYYDAIILDEAQDYSNDELDVFCGLGTVVFAAADKRQRIYTEGDDGLEKRFVDNVYPLKFHYRNGTSICKVADALAKGWTNYTKLEPTCNYDEKKAPSSVQIAHAKTLEAQVKNAAAAIKLQNKAYPDELLGVLCYKRGTLKKVAELLRAEGLKNNLVLQSIDEGYVSFENGKDVCACTIHGAKGLEFRALHLMNGEELNSGGLIRNVCYTGVTRAKTSLTVHHTNPLPPFFQSALNSINPPVPTAKLDDLFGSKSAD